MRKPSAIVFLLTALVALLVACSGDIPLAADEGEAPTSPPAEAEPQAEEEESPAPTDAPRPTAEPTDGDEPEGALPPPPTSDAPSVLPASLYYINGEDGQIYRMERDGTTRVQVTYEPNPVDEFAVTATGERVAYATNNSLYLVDLFGAGRTAIAEGNPDEEDFFLRLRDLTWSPDGRRLAYHDGGMAIYDVESGNSSLILPSDPVPNLDDETLNPDEPAVSISPISWSPDGTRLLLQEAIYFSDGAETVVYSTLDGSRTVLGIPDGIVCCNPHWTPDSSAIIVSSDSVGFLTPGMWRIDAETGEGTTLINGNPTGDAEVYTLVFDAQELADGLIYRFQGTIEGFPEQQPPLSMVRSGAEDGTAPTLLHEESWIAGDVLWDPAASGGVMLDLTAQYGEQGFPDFPYRGPLLWLPTEGEPVDLGVVGGDIAWGD